MTTIINLSDGLYVENMYGLSLFPISDKQIIPFEFFVIRNSVRKMAKDNWFVEANDNCINLYFSSLKDLSIFKLTKIFSRFDHVNLF